MTNAHRFSRRLLLLSLTCLFFTLGAAPRAEAQPNLNFKRVTVNWPTIELYFAVSCNGSLAFNLSKQDFRLYENGVEIKDFTLWCPDPNVRCAISVALVFDASLSMQGAPIAGAKQAGHTFINLMDGVLDEATVIGFNDVVTIHQQKDAFLMPETPDFSLE